MADLSDGESTEMQGSGAKPYVLKNIGGVYSCSCPAWRNQSVPIERRTCKHLRKLRGDAAEKERLGGELATRVKVTKSNREAPPLLLAQTWDNTTDLAGWWMSEKLDGVRAYWDGEKFLSRLGNVYHAPDWFVEGFPDQPLDGELWIGRRAFQKTVSIVRRQDKSEHWKRIKFVVFDAPSEDGGFEDRLKYLQRQVHAAKLDHVQALEQSVCEGTKHLKEELSRIEDLGGEGLMLRRPDSEYEVGRSWSLLKVKTFFDAEAIVLDHIPGKGRHKGRLGALSVQLPDGTRFSVGTGFSDRQRENPPEPGEVVMFRYQEMSDAGVPRFPSFVRLVEDETAKATFQAAAETKKQAAAGEKTPPDPEPPAANARYFELVDDKSSKFWQISQSGSEVTVRYGKIGTNGATRTKDLADVESARQHADKLVAQKTSKGYEEK